MDVNRKPVDEKTMQSNYSKLISYGKWPALTEVTTSTVTVSKSAPQWPLIHPFIHYKVAAAMQGAANSTGSNLGFSVVPKDTMMDLERAGFEPPTPRLLDNSLYELRPRQNKIKNNSTWN